jgi:hypothetical protein
MNGFSHGLPEYGPGNLFPGFGESAAVDILRVGPQSATASVLKEFAGFDVHSFAFSAGGKGKNERKQLPEGKFPGSGKVLGGLLELRG